MTTDTIDLKSRLSQFTGTTTYFYHPLYPWMRYTDGMKFFCENAGNGAYWFLDIMGTELKKHAAKHRRLNIHMSVGGGGEGRIEATPEGRVRPIWTKFIPWTDCPSDFYEFRLTHGVLYLPSED